MISNCLVVSTTNISSITNEIKDLISSATVFPFNKSTTEKNAAEFLLMANLKSTKWKNKAPSSKSYIFDN